MVDAGLEDLGGVQRVVVDAHHVRPDRVLAEPVEVVVGDPAGPQPSDERVVVVDAAGHEVLDQERLGAEPCHGVAVLGGIDVADVPDAGVDVHEGGGVTEFTSDRVLGGDEPLRQRRGDAGGALGTGQVRGQYPYSPENRAWITGSLTGV